MLHKTRKLVALLLFLGGSAGALRGSPGAISTTLSPTGPIMVGDTFSVTLRIAGYSDTNEIDGFNFKVTYPSALFSFVAGSFNLGAAAGADQQWLSKPNQDGGYSLSDFNDSSTPGTVAISMVDLGSGSPQGGTVAASGFLVSFKLQATAAGAGAITPMAASGGSGPEVLYDTLLSPAGVPTLTGASMTVTTPPPPTIVCPSNITVWTCATNAAVFFTVTATNHCGTNVTVTCAPSSGSLFATGTTTVVCTATDSCGATNTCSFLVRVIKDTTPPLITCPTNITVQCLSNVPPCPATLAQFLAAGGTASDDCDTNLAYLCTDSALVGGTCGGTISRRHTVIDDCTNSASCIQVITVRDTLPPSITCPSNITVQCLSNVPPCPTTLAQFLAAGGTASDNCDTNLTYTCTDSALVGGTCGGTISRRHTVTDDCTNSASCIQVITVRDTIPPVIICPTNITVWTCSNSAPVTFTVTATDNCDTNVSIVCTPLGSGSLFPLGTNVVTCTASDDCANISSCNFIVRVVPDTDPPRIFCPTNLTVVCNRTNGALVTFTVTATDDCDTNVSVTCTPASGSLFPFGTNLVTCTATDDCGKSNQCTFTIRVVRPLVSISLSGTNVVISWTGSGTLQQTDTLVGDGPGTVWIDVPGAPTSPYTIAHSAAKRFYRACGCQ